MKQKQSLLISLILFLMIPVCARAQAWTGIINSTRALDWSNAGIPGGIPNRTTICSTLNPGATAAQINTAIAACPGGQVIFLNAGTYNLAGGIDFTGTDNVTLRGAGPDKTFLKFTSGVYCQINAASICLAGSNLHTNVDNPNLSGSIHNWTAGFAQGATVLTVDSVAGWSVGQLVILDQFNDSADTGSVYVGDRHFIDIAEYIGPGRYCPNVNDAGCGTTSGNKTQQELKTITAINAGTKQITISSPLYMPNWRLAQKPQIWTLGVLGVDVGTMNGVESLSVDSTNDGSYSDSNIQFGNSYKCWVKNVRSINSNRNHVWIYNSARIVVRDSYFYGTKNSASQSYGVESFMSSDDLVENNIFEKITAAIMMGNSYGSVFAYNYTVNSFFANPVGYMSAAFSTNHDVTGMNLFEGNDINQALSDNIHGTSNLATLFRNRIRGQDTPTATSATWAVDFESLNRFGNFIGNVLGTVGQHTVYQDSSSSCLGNLCGNQNISIWIFGYPNGGEGDVAGSSMVFDPLVLSTSFRWGNYDVVKAATQWSSSEVPTSAFAPFISGNPVPANHNLPNSFYLASKPTWWGNIPYPAIGPDVAGGTGPGGFSYLIPANNCYNKTAKNSKGILVFDAASCYLGPALNPPINLKVRGVK